MRLRVALAILFGIFGLIGFVMLLVSPWRPSEPEQAQEGSLRVPKELQNTDIVDKPGASLPLDLPLINQEGIKITLREYFSDPNGPPVILTLGYYGCPMLCNVVISGLKKALMEMSFEPGKDYRIVSVSIDARESVDLAAKKKAAYLTSIGAPKDAEWWQFHVTDAESARRLANTVGFNYFYDKKTDQFAHGAGIFVVTPTGVLSRTLFGISFKPQDIKLALSEGSEGKVGSFIDKVIMSCFHYNPDSHRYGIYILGVMRLFGVVTVLVLATVLLMYFRSERKRITF